MINIFDNMGSRGNSAIWRNELQEMDYTKEKHFHLYILMWLLFSIQVYEFLKILGIRLKFFIFVAALIFYVVVP